MEKIIIKRSSGIKNHTNLRNFFYEVPSSRLHSSMDAQLLPRSPTTNNTQIKDLKKKGHVIAIVIIVIVSTPPPISQLPPPSSSFFFITSDHQATTTRGKRQATHFFRERCIQKVISNLLSGIYKEKGC